LPLQVYGIPRLYRKSQQLARWSISDKTTLKIVSGRIGYVYRVPNTFIGRNECVRDLRASLEMPCSAMSHSLSCQAWARTGKSAVRSTDILTRDSLFVAARWFGPTANQLARTLPSGPVPLQEGRSSTTQNILKSSFANRIVTGSAPAYSKSLLARTLRSGQHYFQLRGSSVPRAGLHSALRPLQMSLNSPAAAAALSHLRKPFNFDLGHSFTGQRTFVYTWVCSWAVCINCCSCTSTGLLSK